MDVNSKVNDHLISHDQKFYSEKSIPSFSSRHLSLQFYSQLNREQVKNLIDLYRLDLELFGYDATPYISAAKF